MSQEPRPAGNADKAAAELWLTPARFALLLALALAAAFPEILLNGQTWFYRDYGVLSYPTIHFQRESFWRGELPFWNPFSNCGTPFLAQWGTMTLYPGALIYLLLPLPWSLGCFCLAHLFLGGLGACLLAARWTGSRFAAAVAGFIFVFNGVTLSCLTWPNYVAALAWLPWLVLAGERGGSEGGRWLAYAALIGALQMLTGVPEIILLTWLLLVALALGQVLTGKAFHPSAFILHPLPRRLVLIILLVAGLSAAQLLPFFDLLAHSQRDPHFAGSKWPMPPWGWGNLLVPLFHYFQTPEGTFIQEGQQFLTSYHLGLGVLALAAFALWRVRSWRVWLLGALTLILFTLALGEAGGLYPWLRQLFPALGLARYPVKFILLTPLTMGLLAAFAIGWCEAQTETVRSVLWRKLLPLAILLPVLTALVLWWARQHPFTYDQPALTQANAAARLQLLFLALVLVALAFHPRFRPFQTATRLGLLVVLALDALTHLPHLNPALPNYVFTPGLAAHLLKLEPAPAAGAARVLITPAAEQRLLTSGQPDLSKDLLAKRLALWSHLNLLDDLPKVNGSSTLQLRAQAQVQQRLYAATTNDFPRLLDFLAVTHQTAPGQIAAWTNRPTARPWITIGQRPVFTNSDAILPALFAPGFDPRHEVYLPAELSGSVRAGHCPEAKIISHTFTANEITVTVETPGPALVVLAQSFCDPWQARINGQITPLWRANHAFQAVEVPAGRSTVQLVYRDRAFQLGLGLSGLALAACGWISWRERKR